MIDILIGRNDSASVNLDPHYGNRHGMIADATGTGKSVSVMVLAEGFSRLAKLKPTGWKAQANPMVRCGIDGKPGHPMRATTREMGPTLLETMGKQTARTVGSPLGRQIPRGVRRGIFGGKR